MVSGTPRLGKVHTIKEVQCLRRQLAHTSITDDGITAGILCSLRSAITLRDVCALIFQPGVGRVEHVPRLGADDPTVGSLHARVNLPWIH